VTSPSSNSVSPITLGTAGHIDHGKTVLVEALTGTDTDRLPQERERGISIELGFASLALPGGRPVSVVDVPGHERFVRTMVAGATGIDLFLLVVAADDGVMPQTREHVAVLQMLDVQAGVIALTKTDLVEADGVALAQQEIEELLGGGPFAGSEVVPVCAPASDGLDALVVAIDRLAARLPGRAGQPGEPRLHVDRCFTLHGAGTIVTGTLWSGTLSAGQEVRIEPSGRVARVRGIEVHGEAQETAAAGQRVALNLAGIDRKEIERGDVVTATESMVQPTYRVDVALDLLPDLKPLRQGARVQVHHGTRESPARVAPLEGDRIEPCSTAYAQLRLERPLVAAAGDRLVLRQVAPPDTIGGGSVIDPAPRRHGAGADRVAHLRLLESGDALSQLAARLARAPSGLGSQDGESALLEELRAAGRAVRIGERRPRYFDNTQLERSRERLIGALEQLGKDRPASRGALADRAEISEQAASALLDGMVESGQAVARGPGYLAASAVRDDPRTERVLTALELDFLEPRGVNALAEELDLPAGELRELLESLSLEERVVRVKPGLYFHPLALAAAARTVAEICERAGFVTIASLRDRLATSRRYSQALLEHFDSTRVTRREGDRHFLR
jgi:selenocysteine-specific elongation factor